MIHIPQFEHLSILFGSCDLENVGEEPFSDLVCNFLNDLSKMIRDSKEAVSYPDVQTFAFWCRRAHVLKLKSDFNDGKIKKGRGLVFHITPSNVPVNFAFSFVWSLLAGNTNVVRLSSKKFPQADIICSSITKLCANSVYKPLKKRNLFIRYERDEKITQFFSNNCDVRMIWGGDKTIQEIRKIEIPPWSFELTFPDRYSACILQADEVLKLSQAELKQLVLGFYNDTLLTDQNACSSPQLIGWIGSNIDQAKSIFWRSFGCLAKERYDCDHKRITDKYLKLHEDLIDFDFIQDVHHEEGKIFRIQLAELPLNLQLESLKSKFGSFYEVELLSLASFFSRLTRKTQTLTCFGFSQTEIASCVKRTRMRGVDRIVTVGKALEMETIWDGFEMILTLSRSIDLGLSACRNDQL